MTKPKFFYVPAVKYTIHPKLGDYSFEEITIEVANNLESPLTGDEMIAEARRIAVAATTQAKLKKQKEYAEEQEPK